MTVLLYLHQTGCCYDRCYLQSTCFLPGTAVISCNGHVAPGGRPYYPPLTAQSQGPRFP